MCARARVRERETEVLLTIKKLLKVGKDNALSGDTVSGRSAEQLDKHGHSALFDGHVNVS
jgi:hypothetical protein